MRVGSPSRLAKALAFGAITALVGVLAGMSPPALEFDEQFGLGNLFSWRGARDAPAGVVIVSLDKVSAERLQLPREIDAWPRALHARLVENLTRFGAAVIAYDVVFDKPRNAQDDAAFASAIRRAGNVVLFEYLESESQTLHADGKRWARLVNERLVPPIPQFADAAAATAPFPLPKVPVRVNQFWVFKTGAGDRPSLATAAFQLYALQNYPQLLQLIKKISPDHATRLPGNVEEVRKMRDLHHLVGILREVIAQHGHAYQLALGELNDGPARRLLESIGMLYRDAAPSRYLNFYGPPRNITTVSFADVVLARNAKELPVDIRGAAVFVGLAEPNQPFQRDTFHTVFSQTDGRDLSGVEIAATGFANLRDGTFVRPMTRGAHIALIAAWGVLIGFVAIWWRAVPALFILAALATLYVALAYARFSTGGHWHPLAVPLLLQLPLVILAGLLWHYAQTNHERRRIREAFGMYVPHEVVDRLSRNFSQVQSEQQTVYGVCLASDAEQYTALAEALDPAELRQLMNRYYAVLFEPVRAGGGFVSDVVGDAMLAIWAGGNDPHEMRKKACEAALAIGEATQRFNDEIAPFKLRTRIGLSAGTLSLGSIGAIDHFEYRAVGDIVNVASRLEALNKRLGTRILLTEEEFSDNSEFVVRRLGQFRLPGKQAPLDICELIGRAESVDDAEIRYCAEFSVALARFQARNWAAAREAFARLVAMRPGDLVARLYDETCERYMTVAPMNTDALQLKLE